MIGGTPKHRLRNVALTKIAENSQLLYDGNRQSECITESLTARPVEAVQAIRTDVFNVAAPIP